MKGMVTGVAGGVAGGMTPWAGRFSAAAERVRSADAVVEVLKLAERDDVLSLAGGLPDPRVFDLDATRAAMEEVLGAHGRRALNYSPNPGLGALREFIAARMGEVENVVAAPDEILVTTGAVEAIRHLFAALAGPGDPVLLENPTYLAALHVLREIGAAPEGVDCDGEGMIPAALDERAAALRRLGAPPRLVYLGPSFQNPTGRTSGLRRREELLAVCARHDLVVVEDHAYAELRYDGSPIPSLKALDPDRVAFVHTFSKIFGPGLRLGWVAARPDLIRRLGLMKLGTDQCSGALVQHLALAYGRSGALDAQVLRARRLYRAKRDAMAAAIARHLPARVPVETPAGGFFFWVDLGDGADTGALLGEAMERRRVAFVAGSPFFADPDSDEARRTLRLSFSYVGEDLIEEGVRRLGEALGAA